jgi:hypothetical protein
MPTALLTAIADRLATTCRDETVFPSKPTPAISHMPRGKLVPNDYQIGPTDS